MYTCLDNNKRASQTDFCVPEGSWERMCLGNLQWLSREFLWVPRESPCVSREPHHHRPWKNCGRVPERVSGDTDSHSHDWLWLEWLVQWHCWPLLLGDQSAPSTRSRPHCDVTTVGNTETENTPTTVKTVNRSNNSCWWHCYCCLLLSGRIMRSLHVFYECNILLLYRNKYLVYLYHIRKIYFVIFKYRILKSNK